MAFCRTTPQDGGRKANLRLRDRHGLCGRGPGIAHLHRQTIFQVEQAGLAHVLQFAAGLTDLRLLVSEMDWARLVQRRGRNASQQAAVGSSTNGR